MEINYLKPFRVSLKLAEGKSPHIYTPQLKVMMENDTSLHPMMEKTLKMLKKTRTPFIMLATIREVIVDPQNNRHFDRSAEPRGSWVCTLWSEEEIKQNVIDPEGHLKAALKLFQALGYDLFDSAIVSEEYLKSVEELCKPQIESQLRGREL
jgi:hypothetical protein